NPGPRRRAAPLAALRARLHVLPRAAGWSSERRPGSAPAAASATMRPCPRATKPWSTGVRRCECHVEGAADPPASCDLARRRRCRQQVVDQPCHERRTAEPVPELLPVQKLATEQ